MHILKSSIYHSSFENNTFATVQTHKYQKESLDMVYCLLSSSDGNSAELLIQFVDLDQIDIITAHLP